MMRLKTLWTVVLLALLGAASVATANEIAVVCPPQATPPPDIPRNEVYKDTPFKSGEHATYEVTWSGLKAGYGTLEVRPPVKHADRWHRVFHVSASTGDWFRMIFVAKEEMQSISRPWDFGVAKFFMEQDEGKMFSKPFQQKKWLEFDHDRCKVRERIVQPEKPERIAEFELNRGAIDALGVLFHLRTKEFEIGKKERALVYTSEKNWWLEAEPLAVETVEVGAGKFEAMKLKLQTFIGKELQQKGDVFAWIATKSRERQLVQVQGEIKIGSVYIKLHQYKAGS